jgi:hypothetical protein
VAWGICAACYNRCVRKTVLAAISAPVVLLSGRRYAAIKWCAVLLVFAGRLIAHDWLIVPGKRVGPVNATSTEAELHAAFGNTAVKRAQIRINNNTTAPGLEIYGGKPGESLAVVWPRKDVGLRWPLLVIPCYTPTGVDCRWQTAEGVRVGMGIADLEKLNERPFLLYPDPHSNLWTDAWWSELSGPEPGRRGKLADQLGEDVELKFEMRVRPDYFDQGYFSSDAEPLSGSSLPITSMFVWLLSPQRRIPKVDWTIGGRLWSAIAPGEAELLRESLGPDHVHRFVACEEECSGLFPEILLFEGQDDRSVATSQSGMDFCGGVEESYKHCRWHLRKPFALVMTLSQLQKLNGRPFLFNGFGWDYGGLVTSWDGGKLEKRWPRAGSHYVVCKGDYPDRMAGDGDRVRSDDPDLQKLGCSVLYR